MTTDEAFGIVKQWADSVGAISQDDEFVVPPDGEGIRDAIALLADEGYMDLSNDGLGLTEKGKEYIASHEAPFTCDFCLATGAEWTYPVDHSKYIQIYGADGTKWDNDDWAACEECHADIEAGRWKSVAQRSTHNNEYIYGQDRKARRSVIRMLLKMYQEFQAVRVGPAFREPKPWYLPPLS